MSTTDPIAQTGTTNDPLPSWNDGPAKAAILAFVRSALDSSGPDFLPEDERIATFDQDGTLWVEHPLYSQLQFAFHRVGELAPQHPEWKTTAPFAAILAGDRAAIAKFTMQDLLAVVAATHAGMTTQEFAEIVSDWTAKARDPRWNRPYTELVFAPMLEVMQYLRTNGFSVYLVTGGGQAFVRTFAQRVYGVPPERVIGSAGKTEYGYDAEGRGVLTKQPDILFIDDVTGKPAQINLFLGRRPHAAFGNSSGDQQMLEYTQGNTGARLMMLVLHDDAEREYAYGPAQGLPNSGIGTFPQALYDKAKANGWSVISMKNDWKRIFAFDP
jgi:phosphoglycolate phosphatase-like HAD superfamily hydrolase